MADPIHFLEYEDRTQHIDLEAMAQHSRAKNYHRQDLTIPNGTHHSPTGYSTSPLRAYNNTSRQSLLKSQRESPPGQLSLANHRDKHTLSRPYQSGKKHTQHYDNVYQQNGGPAKNRSSKVRANVTATHDEKPRTVVQMNTPRIDWKYDFIAEPTFQYLATLIRTPLLDVKQSTATLVPFHEPLVETDRNMKPLAGALDYSIDEHITPSHEPTETREYHPRWSSYREITPPRQGLAPMALTPQEIVEYLDDYVINQDDAKRTVAVALRNRWRREQLPESLQQLIQPKNILLIGSTGSGKTEIARRLSTLSGAPFLKVEMSSYTEVGYQGKSVDSIITDLVQHSLKLIKSKSDEFKIAEARRNVNQVLSQQIVLFNHEIDRMMVDLETKYNHVLHPFHENVCLPDINKMIVSPSVGGEANKDRKNSLQLLQPVNAPTRDSIPTKSTMGDDRINAIPHPTVAYRAPSYINGENSPKEDPNKDQDINTQNNRTIYASNYINQSYIQRNITRKMPSYVLSNTIGIGGAHTTTTLLSTAITTAYATRLDEGTSPNREKATAYNHDNAGCSLQHRKSNHFTDTSPKQIHEDSPQQQQQQVHGMDSEEANSSYGTNLWRHYQTDQQYMTWLQYYLAMGFFRDKPIELEVPLIALTAESRNLLDEIVRLSPSLPPFRTAPGQSSATGDQEPSWSESPTQTDAYTAMPNSKASVVSESTSLSHRSHPKTGKTSISVNTVRPSSQKTDPQTVTTASNLQQATPTHSTQCRVKQSGNPPLTSLIMTPMAQTQQNPRVVERGTRPTAHSVSQRHGDANQARRIDINTPQALTETRQAERSTPNADSWKPTMTTKATTEPTGTTDDNIKHPPRPSPMATGTKGNTPPKETEIPVLPSTEGGSTLEQGMSSLTTPLRDKGGHDTSQPAPPAGTSQSSLGSSPSQPKNHSQTQAPEVVRFMTTIEYAQKLLTQIEKERLSYQRVYHTNDLNKQAIEYAEASGIVFLDEIDKLITPPHIVRSSGDASAEAVMADLLPLVEGCTITTQYGAVQTDNILFIAAGAFHQVKPTDLIPELSGRFPQKVKLHPLTLEDMVHILTQTKNNLLSQYVHLFQQENIELCFEWDAIVEMASIAMNLNHTNENIGARQLHSVVEACFKDLSYSCAGLSPRERTRIIFTQTDVTNATVKLREKYEFHKFLL